MKRFLLLVLLILMILMIISRKENFKSVNSDFIENNGYTDLKFKKINDIISLFKNQLNNIPQTKNTGKDGYYIPMGWDRLFIPKGKSENDVIDNLGNMDTKSFVKVLGLEQNLIASQAEKEILENRIKLLFPNCVKLENNEPLINDIVKEEDNIFTFVFYLLNPQLNIYYGKVNGKVQIQNGTVVIIKLTFKGLVTPLSVENIESSEHFLSKKYDEIQMEGKEFTKKEYIDKKLKDFEKNKQEILLRMNAYSSNRQHLKPK